MTDQTSFPEVPDASDLDEVFPLEDIEEPTTGLGLTLSQEAELNQAAENLNNAINSFLENF